MKNSTNKLQAISDTYCSIEHNDDNYSIGGGLDTEKFASRRHEDARGDKGKLTLGEATKLFKKATGLETSEVRAILELAVPNMEWHHAGKLPKSYGGGMKKTYFLKASEIYKVASSWDAYAQKLNSKKSCKERRLDFLLEHSKPVDRTEYPGEFFYITTQEMKGKNGWFNSENKSYNLPEYFSGWKFANDELYQEFFNIK